MSPLSPATLEPTPVRAAQVQQLKALLAQPDFQLVTVSGAAGVGKSHLIREVLQNRPHIAGKFDTGKDAMMAYGAFIQAIRTTLHQLLSLPDSLFQDWQERFRREVPMAALLPALPELAYFQMPNTHAEAGEKSLTDTLSLTRPFERAFLKLWQCLAENRQGSELSSVWLDDVQWMDKASMAFFEFLLIQDLPVHWILTGRDTGAVERLLSRLDIRSVTRMHLEPFSESEAEAFVLEQLGRPQEGSQELVAFLYQLSQGYPLELAWGMKELVHEQKMVYAQGWQFTGQLADLASGPHKGWEQMMHHQWQSLALAVQTLLHSAALLGPKFSCQQLHQVLPDAQEADFTRHWNAALDSGFLIQGLGDEGQFAHDRLFEWVIQTLEPAIKIQRQLEMARILLHGGQASLELLVELLNASRTLLKPDEQQLRLEKNLQLIRVMLSQGAIGQARSLLELISPEIGTESELYPSFQVLRGSQAYLANEMTEAESVLQALLLHRQENVLDAQLLLIVIFTQHNRYHEAVMFALALLASQGLEINRDPQNTQQTFKRCLDQVMSMSNVQLQACANAPSSVQFETRMQIIATVAVAIYNYDLELYSICVLYALDQILQGQGTSRAATIFSAASLLLLSQTGDLQPAFKLNHAAECLAQETGRDDELTLIHCVMGDMISPWKLPFAEARNYLISSREAGSRSGNLQFAGYACVFLGANLFLCAHPLAALQEMILPELIQFNQRTQNFSPLDGLRAYDFLLEKLRKGHFQSTGQSETDFIADLRQRESRADLSRYFTYKAFVLMVFGECEAAYAALLESELEIYLPGSIVRVWHLLLRDVLRWRLNLAEPTTDLPPLLPFDLATLANLNPDNFEPLYRIWLAEQPGQTATERLKAYHHAASAAREKMQWHWEGFAFEQIALMQAQEGLELLAQQSLLESIAAYQQWEASAKVEQLSQRLTSYHQRRYQQSKQQVSQDVAEILSVCADFSKILDPEALQLYILQVLKTQTQADQIAFMFRADDGQTWRCVTLSEQEPESLQAASSQVPLVLLNYVARTHQSVVLPTHKELFSHREISDLQGVHMLIPLVFQQTLSGIIYLQPNTQSTFFGFQAEVLLQALGGYLAGTLHNALRSQNLEQLIAVRTADLKKANQRLSQLLEERQEVLAIAAHDLKHPLGTLKLGLSMLEQLYDSLSLEIRQKAFENLNQTVEDMNHNTERLLMIEHLETDILRPQWKELPLSEVLTPFLHRYEWSAREKNQQLVFRGFQQDAMVETDPDMLKIILNNLLENAVKFSPLNATIELELDLEPDRYFIRIYDQGPGISTADQVRLFQKFGRLSARPTAGESSHGLGLFIVRQLVDDLAGQIRIENQRPQGCMFQVGFKLKRK